MTNLIKVEGIVINKKDIGDFDRIITLFSSSFGKIDILIKGIRKSRKRDKIGADILSYSKIVAYKKENSFVGSTVESVKSYDNIRIDMSKIGIVLYIFHVLNNILSENERKSSIYDLLVKSLDYIEKENNIKNSLILLIFFINKIVEEEGIKFNIENGNIFSIQNSLICNKYYNDSFKLTDNELNIIHKIYFNKVRELLKENMELRDLYSVLIIYEKYINYHMEIHLDLKNYILEA